MVLFQYLKHTQEQHRVHAVWDVHQAMTRGQKLFIDLTIKGTSSAWGPRLYSPSLTMGRRRYTRVCKVRVAQCVYLALSGSRSQTSIEQAPVSCFRV